MKLPVIILGGGGHAKVLLDILRIRSENVVGICAPYIEEVDESLSALWIGDDDSILKYTTDSVLLVNGLGSIGGVDKRKQLFDRLSNDGYRFASVIHPSAVIADDVKLSDGVQIMAGAIIQPGSRIGVNTIINTKVSVDHDCVIGNHVHVAPGATLSGGVHVGNEVHIGTGATVIQGVHIGHSTVVGAGTLVLSHLPERVKAIGLPAKVMQR